MVLLAHKLFEKILFISFVNKIKIHFAIGEFGFFFSAKILLFLENLVIKNYYLHWYEILGEACRMSILHPLKNFVSPPYKLFMKMNFSVRENWQKCLEKSKMYAHAKHARTIWRCMLSIRLQLVSVCWACAYNLYTHAEHTLTICLLMLSMRFQNSFLFLYL